VVKETQALLGDVEGAVVKWASGFHSAKTMMPEASYQLIREKVLKAVRRIKDFKPYKLTPPIQLDVRFKNYQHYNYGDYGASILGCRRRLDSSR
jgi:D-amino peptidase